MSIAIRPLHAVFAGEVTGIDLRQPASRADVAAVEAGMDRFAVLVFPRQEITDEEQQAFTDNFGKPNPKQGGNITGPEQKRLRSGIGDLSNLDEKGTIISAEDRRWFFKLGDRLWHSDSSYRAVPAKYSLLSGRVLPSWGGNTEFADLRAAYDALDARTKSEVEELVCEHSLIFSRGSIGFDDLTDAERKSFRPVRQRLVRTHPVTGRKSLFLSSHAGTILGWTVPEARMFLRDLMEFATQPRFVYSHVWRPYDLVMWDNRTTVHRARRFDRNEVRDVRRTTVAGDEMTVAQAEAA